MDTQTGLILVEADFAYAHAYADMANEYLQHESEIEPHEAKTYRHALEDINAHIRLLRDHSRGEGLSKGMVRQTTYWLIDDDRILGTSRLRHELTPPLRYEGGHIGYGIRPSCRGRGYGNVICQLTLDRARRIGMKQVLLTCKDTNIASMRIIESNGGVLENKVISRETGELMRRYWIAL